MIIENLLFGASYLHTLLILESALEEATNMRGRRQEQQDIPQLLVNTDGNTS